MHIKTVEQGKERKREETGGKRGGKTSRFEGFLSLWWIDRENRGSHKERCKNRIAPLPGHLSSFPIYLITSPLDALSPVLYFHLRSSALTAVIFCSFLCFLLCLFSPLIRLLIPNPNERQNPFRPSRFAPSSHCGYKGFKTFCCADPRRHTYTINFDLL